MDFPRHVGSLVDKYGIAHFVFQAVTGRNFLIMMHFCCIDLFSSLRTMQTLMKCRMMWHVIIGLYCLPKYLFAGIQNEKG